MMHPSHEEVSQLLTEHEEERGGGGINDLSRGRNSIPIGPQNRFATAEQRRRRATYDAAQQSAQAMMVQQSNSHTPHRRRRRHTAKRIVQKGWRSARDMIQKVNIGRWIDDLEHDQQIAEDLDRINNENQEEEERKKLVAHVHMLCMNAIQDHLISFQLEHPNGTYEEWIAELHPDNVITTTKHANDNDDNHTTTASTTLQIDPRFYVADSDHLILWRQCHNKSDNA